MVDDTWACPDCGRTFANMNQWHSCLELSLADRLAESSATAVGLFHAIESVIADSGPYRIHAQRTRIAFIDRMTFASVVLAREWVDLGFVTAVAVGDERVRTIEMYGPTTFAHVVRVAAVDDIDSDVRDWLTAAHRRGSQDSPGEAAGVTPVVGVALARLRIPMPARVVESDEAPGIGLPWWAAAALAGNAEVTMRMGGTDHGARVVDRDDRAVAVPEPGLLEALGLTVGDSIDVTVRPLR